MGKKAPKTARTRPNEHSVPSRAGGHAKIRKQSRHPHRKPAGKPKKRKTKLPPAYLTVAEKDAFMAVVKSPRDKAIFRLLYHHGLRASEPALLDLSDYRRGNSMDADMLRIRRLKGSIGGDTRLVSACAAAIRAWLKVRGNAPGPLFISRKHRPLGRQRIWVLMQRYCALARIPREKAHPHAWKHTCGMHMVNERHEDVLDVQAQLGHANLANTMVYVRLADPRHEARAKRLRDWK